MTGWVQGRPGLSGRVRYLRQTVCDTDTRSVCCSAVDPAQPILALNTLVQTLADSRPACLLRLVIYSVLRLVKVGQGWSGLVRVKLVASA